MTNCDTIVSPANIRPCDDIFDWGNGWFDFTDNIPWMVLSIFKGAIAYQNSSPI
ncbi:MAG: hypothetical protein VKL59_02130 [Nostocaceae cyanobacterium]|nr:hypothetical protein [Nostocaceae cyanobacterium]